MSALIIRMLVAVATVPLPQFHAVLIPGLLSVPGVVIPAVAWVTERLLTRGLNRWLFRFRSDRPEIQLVTRSERKRTVPQTQSGAK